MYIWPYNYMGCCEVIWSVYASSLDVIFDLITSQCLLQASVICFCFHPALLNILCYIHYNFMINWFYFFVLRPDHQLQNLADVSATVSFDGSIMNVIVQDLTNETVTVYAALSEFCQVCNTLLFCTQLQSWLMIPVSDFCTKCTNVILIFNSFIHSVCLTKLSFFCFVYEIIVSMCTLHVLQVLVLMVEKSRV